MKILFTKLIVMVLLSSCMMDRGNIEVQYANKKIVSISSIQLVNNQFVISGKNLNEVTTITITEGATQTSLEVDSKTMDQLIANTLSNVTFAAGKVFNFVLTSAHASTSFTVDFSLCNSTLNGKAFDCTIAAVDKDVLSYDANTNAWIPRSINGLSYQGTYNAASAVVPTGGAAGDYYIISNPGTIGGVSYLVGDWISFNGTIWQKVANSSAIVSSVFGRIGVITAAEGDYNLNKLSDVDLATTAPIAGDVLEFDGTNWVPAAPAAAGGAGTVTSVSGTAPISVATGTTTPVVSIATAASGIAGALSSTAFDIFNNKLGPTLTSANIFVGNGSNVATGVAMSGDVTINNAGVTAIGAGKITNSMLAGSIDITSKITGALPIANGGTGATTAAGARANLGVGAGTVTSVSGTAPISVATGTTTPVVSIDTAASGVAGVLSNTHFDIFNNKLGPTLTSANIFVGNGSNVATGVAMSGDVTINNAGVTAIGAGKITNSMLAGSIDITSKISGALPVANGGTGATTAVGARANLGLVIGSGAGELMAFSTAMSCFPYEKLQVSAAPYVMTCVTDNANTNYALLAGRASGQTLNGGAAASENLTLQSTAHATKGYVLLNPTSGNVGVGTSSPVAKLEIQGQVRSTASGGAANVNATAAVNWDNGNAQSMSVACTTSTFTNMLDGGTYILAVSETGTTTCTFSQAGLTFFYNPANGNRTNGQRTVYSFQRIGTDVYVSWIAGFQ